MDNRFLCVVLACIVYSCECCEVGWIRLESKCYMFSHDVATWGEAAGICKALNSKLAEPMTNEESSFLSSHSQSLHGTFWIGVTDIVEESKWIYPSTLRPITVTNFLAGQPDGNTGSNCVVLYNRGRGLWADGACTDRFNFVCELSDEDYSLLQGR